ncbi:EAL domain-containing protein [Devosia sp. 2618]|uniref:putative bifunctional diguanylate cyclase/phosphodiesterase n=1 Tax=Devosia sp. 2618 TaxID=3156454 RepID=UPI003394994D
MTIRSIVPFPVEMEFVRYALDSAAIVAMTDVKGQITFVNRKFCEISGYSKEELVGGNHRMLHSGVHDEQFFREMYRVIANGNVWHGEICNRRKDGTLYWVDTTIVPHVGASGRVDSYTAIRFDITARHQAQSELHRIVNVDPMTGIPNRRHFQQYLEEALRAAGSKGEAVFLALLDIDTFKEINDWFGHDVGDRLLRIIGERLGTLGQAGYFVARLGGDEFGIVLTGKSSDRARAIINQVLAMVRQPALLGDFTRRCTASIGVSESPGDGETAEELFKNADLALYRAKDLGRDRASFFENRLRDVSRQRNELAQTIEDGLNRGQFLLHYQPVVPVAPGGVVSLEGLLRWRHPIKGMTSPGEFLSDLHDPGLFAELGMLVVELAVQDMVAMMEQGLPVGRVAINVTNADFRSDQFANKFFELIESVGLPPSKFCMEVTEGVFLGRDFADIERRICRLHEAGVEVALDDFGTGFASLSHLRRMPIDRVKIDRTFVSNLAQSSADLAIVRGIIDISHGMGMVVTAEGVETREQFEMLRDLGCDSMQGWYFAKAQARDRLPYVLKNLPSTQRLPGEVAHRAAS